MKFSDVRIVESGLYVDSNYAAISLCIVCDASFIDIHLTEKELAEMLAEIRRNSPNPPVTS